jgi:hypothetical protein
VKQTVLKRKTPLRSFMPLKAYKSLNKISPKQRVINAEWKTITDQKAHDLNNTCQWCGKIGSRTDSFNPLDGHHIQKRRYHNDSPENCYVCHRVSCHRFIEDNNIDVRDFPDKYIYENLYGQ